jgi:hypothetical protein
MRSGQISDRIGQVARRILKSLTNVFILQLGILTHSFGPVRVKGRYLYDPADS